MRGFVLEPIDGLKYELINTAERLASLQRPTTSDLRRAVSTAYYALFHSMCALAADSLLGREHPDRCERAWAQTYRALNHGTAFIACKKCANNDHNFPKEIQAFADYFITMQGLRHDADYDPKAKFSAADVASHVSGALKAIESLDAAPEKHRRAFAALVLFHNSRQR